MLIFKQKSPFSGTGKRNNNKMSKDLLYYLFDIFITQVKQECTIIILK